MQNTFSKKSPAFRIAFVLPFMLACASAEENASTPQEIQPEPSTLHCLAVRWPVKGDANENAVIEVQYRKMGGKNWQQGYPLFRTLKAATSNQQGQWNFEHGIPPQRLKGGRIYAGSIVDLTPETEYEAKFSLKDPDGGDTEKILKLKTLGEPKDPPGMKVKHVAPGVGGGSGTPQDPLKGLAAALGAAEPGVVLLFHAGTYPVTGTLNIAKGGEPGKPLVLRGAGDGEVIFDGGGGADTKGGLLCINGTKHLWFEGLTLQGRYTILIANRCSHLVIRRCKFHKTTQGIIAKDGGYDVSRGHFITDNVFIGPTTWPRTKGIEAPAAIYQFSGSGHVVCYNKVTNMADSFHGTGHGNLSASDYHNNDITICTDDGFECDYAETNIRAYRNRILNVIHGITAQPAQGGPIYMFRNLIYNATYSPFKLNNDTCGVLLFHNTCLRNGPCLVIQPANETVTDIWSRNNLFLGTGGAALPTTGRMIRCNFDNDGFGGYSGPFSVWNNKTYQSPEEAKAGGVIYKEKGALAVDPKTCFAGGLLPPADTKVVYKAEDLDFRLKEGSGAIDKGVVLFNFNDGFAGKAPDLGALEFGAPLPHYGPRPVERAAELDKIVQKMP